MNWNIAFFVVEAATFVLLLVWFTLDRRDKKQ